MSLIWRTLPADWPSFTDLDGHTWRLAPNDFWWLSWGGQWHQAASVAVGDVHGIPVPPDILRKNRNWLGTGTMTALAAFGRDCAVFGNLMAHHERQITRSFLMPPGSSVSKRIVPLTADETAITPIAKVYPALAAPPDVPPDFAEIPLGADCCLQCHLDDGPLYKGGLCRYCWMLAQVPAQTPAAPAGNDPAQLIWKAVFAQGRWATIATLMFVLLALYVAVFAYR